MTYTPEQFISSNKATVKTLEGISNNVYAGIEKLVELNLAASKAVVAESFSHFQAVLGAKDAQELMALQAGVFQPLAEKSVAYGRHLYAIISESGAEFTKAFESKFAEAQHGFATLVEDATKNAPAGTESAVAVFKSAVNASQNVIESAQGSAKKALEMAESNFTAVANQAVKATATGSKKG